MSENTVDKLTRDQIFINLPVADIQAAMSFYSALGWELNPMFSDERTASFVVSDHLVVMLLETARFQEFHQRETYAAGGAREVLNCLSARSKEDVDELLRRVGEGGGTVTRPAEEQGPMYGAAFDDVDGHGWEVMWMDPAVFE